MGSMTGVASPERRVGVASHPASRLADFSQLVG